MRELLRLMVGGLAFVAGCSAAPPAASPAKQRDRTTVHVQEARRVPPPAPRDDPSAAPSPSQASDAPETHGGADGDPVAALRGSDLGEDENYSYLYGHLPPLDQATPDSGGPAAQAAAPPQHAPVPQPAPKPTPPPGPFPKTGIADCDAYFAATLRCASLGDEVRAQLREAAVKMQRVAHDPKAARTIAEVCRKGHQSIQRVCR